MSDETASPTPPAARRGLVGPFSGRQLLALVAVIVVAAVGLTLVTRPIAPGPANATAIPLATPFIVGPPTEGLRPGDVAPELEVTGADGTTVQLTDLDGNPVRLEDLRGKLVWLNFWATWCPPCQSETPVLRDMDEAYGDDGLAIVGIAVQETTPDDVRAYADRYELGTTSPSMPRPTSSTCTGSTRCRRSSSSTRTAGSSRWSTGR